MRQPEGHEIGLLGFHGSKQESLTKSDELLARLSTTFETKQVFIPASAYRDLANVADITFLTRNGKSILQITGGDASSSYTSELIFSGGVLLSKKVIANGFPDQAYEETVYSFVQDAGQ